VIDWANLAANALWILGCALILATLSYASWEASVYNEKMGTRLGRPSYQVALYLGLFLFAAGLAATAAALLARIVWCILALLSLVFLILAARQTRRETESPTTPPGEQ
jgi:hypothetical protein